MKKTLLLLTLLYLFAWQRSAGGVIVHPENQNHMTTDTSKTRDLIVTRTFDAPLEEVWKAWSDSGYVKQWWGPKVFTCPVAKMDFREGGASLVCMRTPDGHDLYNTWNYHKIVPMELIEFVMRFSDADGQAVDPAKMGLPAELAAGVRHKITFRPVDGKTEMTVTEFGYTNDQTYEMSKAGLEECLDKMALIFSKK
ncbi:SRPBCC family protein [Chitinophaga lutea]|nr:SRPBCC domain-containing protein [Chitinophaga lutea]